MIEELIEPRFEGSNLIIETGSETEIYDAKFLVAALCIYVAKSDGSISEPETEKMLELIGEHFHLESAESLGLLTRAMADLADNPDLASLLKQLSTVLEPQEKEDVAVMLLKIVAADGRKEAEEMQALADAADIVDIPPDLVHNAFDRYFADKRSEEGD